MTNSSESRIPGSFGDIPWAGSAAALTAEMGGAVWLVGDDGQVVLANASARALGKPTGGGRQSLPVLTGPGAGLDLAGLVRQGLDRGERVVLDNMELVLSQGVTEIVSLRVVPVRAGSGRWVAWVLVVPGSDRAELALQEVHDERLASLTGLAAKIAHELNNPLDGSMRYIGLALRRVGKGAELDDREKVEGYLSSAREALAKIQEILSDLVNFAHDGQATIERISVNELIEQAVKTLALRAQSENISIVTVLAESLPRVGGPRLYRVFCNVIKNAIDAIQVRRRRDPTCPGLVTVRSEHRGDRVLIRVEDTGDGLPADRSRLFDPFFTTRSRWGGTGLGLAIARDIVGECSGRIWAEAGSDGGATFVIELPVEAGCTGTGGHA